MSRILTAIVIASLVACKEVRTEKSPVLNEDARVIAHIYSPSEHRLTTQPAMFDNPFEPRLNRGSGISLDSNLNVSYDTGQGMRVTAVTVPETYGVLFSCPHGSFTVQGQEAKHKALYIKLEDGQNVKVIYQEEYNAVYDDRDGDGKKELIERTLTGYDFIDAVSTPTLLIPHQKEM